MTYVRAIYHGLVAGLRQGYMVYRCDLVAARITAACEANLRRG